MDFDTIRFVIGAVYFFGVVGFALCRGAAEERLGALLMLAATLLTPMLVRHVRLSDPQWGVAIVDAALLVALLIMTWSCRRYWLMAAAALQLLNTTSHVAVIFDPSIGGLAYVSSRVFWSYLVMSCLLVGTIQTVRRQAQFRRVLRIV